MEPEQSVMLASVEAVLHRLADGAELHRVGSERTGVRWIIVPGRQPVASATAEAAAAMPGVIRAGSAVGRVSSYYRMRRPEDDAK